MTTTSSYFFISTSMIFLIYTGCVYSLYNSYLNIDSYYKNNLVQKIFYVNSKKTIDIYKNNFDNNIYILELKNTDNKYIQTIKIDKSNFNYFNNNKEIEFCKDILTKKMIKISPGGLYGFYDAGICSIIKKKYNLDNYIFSGASAGAWNSLFLSYKNDIDNLIKSILDININFSSVKELQIILKKKILQEHKSEEFDLKKIYISVCVLDNFEIKNCIFTDFVNLEDAIDCCIASSNIPFLTGNLIHRYRNKITFDGGFLKHQSIICKKTNFYINYTIWNRKRFFTSLFDKKNNNIHKTYSEGIYDTNSNTNMLDIEFL